MRAYGLLIRDLLLHSQIWLLVQLLQYRMVDMGSVRWFYGSLLAAFIREGREVTDTSERALTLKHDLFRHTETELFIPASQLERAVALTKGLTDWFGGAANQLDPALAAAVDHAGLRAEVERLCGSYIQHYPIYFRRVLPDDTLISMTAQATEPYYSMSLFTYLPARDHAAYNDFVRVLATLLARTCQVRPHWGKYCPLDAADLARLYPRLETFQQACAGVDPQGVFRNAYTRRVIGF
jgi:hypothetical protein